MTGKHATGPGVLFETPEERLRRQFYDAADHFIDAVESGAPMEKRDEIADDMRHFRSEYYDLTGLIIDRLYRCCGEPRRKGAAKCPECGREPR